MPPAAGILAVGRSGRLKFDAPATDGYIPAAMRNAYATITTTTTTTVNNGR